MPAVKLLEHGGQRLDRYELVGEIASGGMATVYLARILGVGGFQRFVAIKRLHPHLANEQEFIEMFLDEARLAASIHHPNVVPILEVGTSDRGYYLVMEYIEGDTMARLLARATTAGERIPAPIVIRIVLDTLAGLHAAHELRDELDNSLALVHRDVSPQNILVGIDGTTRIADFGVARAATRLSSTRSGQLKGKLAYMAPEQARGGAIDRRADLFAVGTVLWEALADKRLFRGDGEAETLNRVLFEPIPRLSSALPTVPLALEEVTMKALERAPAQRFSTALEFYDELERAARSVHLLAGTRDIATYVQQCVGQVIAQQREAVRVWLAQSEPSRTELGPRERLGPIPLQVHASSSSVTSTAISIPPSAPTREASEATIHEELELPPNHGRRNVAIFFAGIAAVGALSGLYLSTRPDRAIDPVASNHVPSAPPSGSVLVVTVPSQSTVSSVVMEPPAARSDAGAAARTDDTASKHPPQRKVKTKDLQATPASSVKPALPDTAPPPEDVIPRNPYRYP